MLDEMKHRKNKTWLTNKDIEGTGVKDVNFRQDRAGDFVAPFFIFLIVRIAYKIVFRGK